MQLADVYTSVPLTNISLAYKNENYIAEQVAPIFPVVKDTGKIFSYGMSNLRIVNTYRSVGGKPNIVEMDVSSADHYILEDHVLGTFIAQEIIDNYDKPIKPKMDHTENLVDRILVDKEKALADVITNTSYITNNTTLSGTSQWDDYENSDPFEDITTAITTVRSACGMKPNTMIIAWDVLQKLKFHPDVKDMFKGVLVITDKLLEENVGRIFGIKRMLVGEAQYNNSNKGGTDTLADIWTKDVVIAYIEPRPSEKSRCFCNTYQKTPPRSVQYLPQAKGGLELVQRNSDYIQVKDKYDQVLVDETCAYLIEAAIS